ncbi:unnamed protein product [Dovyalis caffra]|uniref:Uncharacterized protein n=1 Tax=Dovyalis caffra TaxID=77055 RepID=A0AAV1RIM3_9ROSI|nr:unnamed protein product [Dovyalis caffra]
MGCSFLSPVVSVTIFKAGCKGWAIATWEAISEEVVGFEASCKGCAIATWGGSLVKGLFQTREEARWRKRMSTYESSFGLEFRELVG